MSLMDPTLLSAVPIINTGTTDAENVVLSSITLNDGTLTSPTSLPFNLGTIPADSSVVLNADFADTFMPSGSYALTVEGTYKVGADTFCFELNSELTVPPAAPGDRLLITIDVIGQKNDDVPYPPQTPSQGTGVNIPRWTVPTAPFIDGIPTLTSTEPETINGAANVFFDANNGGINGTTIANTSTTTEPSGASNGGDVVFVTGNWFAAYSTDGGATFTALNPTTVFPADAVGFCCDQVVQYVPSIDRFIWLLQGNGYRIATASPQAIIDSGGTAWTYWNLTPDIFGSCSSFDYPDLSVGDDFLYMSWDAGGGGCSSGFQVARAKLTELEAGGTITIGFTNPADGPMAWGSHLMQDTLDEIFWAGHNNNSSMRVFSLHEDSNTYSWRDVEISSWANNSPITSTTPDGQNWVNFLFNPTTQNPGGGFPSNSVLGSTRVFNQLWFAWSAGTDDNFDRPHVEMVTLDKDDFSVIQQVQIWNNDYAFAYPALTTNLCTQEVGFSMEYGGNGNYENHVVGFWGDFIAYITTNSDVGTTRYGDYVTIRQTPVTEDNPGNLFDAFGYGLNTVPPPGSGTQVDVHHLRFGRPSCSTGPN